LQKSKVKRSGDERKPKKYRVKIFMVKPFEFVDVWGEKPDLDDALEAFSGEVLTIDASEYFRVEVSEA
jgi:hypothetical protein